MVQKLLRTLLLEQAPESFAIGKSRGYRIERSIGRGG